MSIVHLILIQCYMSITSQKKWKVKMNGTYNNVDKSQMHYANWKKSDSNGYSMLLFLFWRRQKYRDKKGISSLWVLEEKGGKWFMQEHQETLRVSEMFYILVAVVTWLCMFCRNSEIFTKKNQCILLYYIIPTIHNFRKSAKVSLISLLNLPQSGVLALSLANLRTDCQQSFKRIILTH